MKGVCIDEHGFSKAEHLQYRDAEHQMCSMIAGKVCCSPPSLQVRYECASASDLITGESVTENTAIMETDRDAAFNVNPPRET